MAVAGRHPIEAMLKIASPDSTTNRLPNRSDRDRMMTCSTTVMPR